MAMTQLDSPFIPHRSLLATCAQVIRLVGIRDKTATGGQRVPAKCARVHHC